MSKNKIELSLIVPCYNEGEHLEKSFPKVIEVLRKLNQNFEIIIIDDFSKDNTVEIIKRLIKNNKEISISFVSHKHNVGRGGTVTEGIRLAKGDIVGFIDIDLEVSPKYIPDFVKIISTNKADIVVGKRYDYFSITSIHRFISTKLYISLVRLILRLPIHDTETGYKFFNRKKILPILTQIQDVYWFWDTEIIARGYMNGLRLEEIDVLFKKRRDKTSTVKLLRDSIRQIKSFIDFKNNLTKERSTVGTKRE